MRTDRTLLEEQYRDGSNLDARIALHARFSTATRDFHDWLFDYVDARPGMRVLELGCGTGQMWGTVCRRVPGECDLLLSDFSSGMLAGTRAKFVTLSASDGSPLRTTWVQSDAQAIPFPGGRFDVVLANHMLYHVPDLPQALGEIRRVLKPGGRLVAATNGPRHMRELGGPAAALGVNATTLMSLSFNLENGTGLLAAHFAVVERYDFKGALEVTEAEPLVAYVLSMRAAAGLATPERVQRLRDIVRERIERDGVFHITAESGLFVAH